MICLICVINTVGRSPDAQDNRPGTEEQLAGTLEMPLIESISALR